MVPFCFKVLLFENAQINLAFSLLIRTFADHMKQVIIEDAMLRQAAGECMDAFVSAFVTAIKEAIGGELTADKLDELNSDQITLLAWDILHSEVMDGGFVQLIHNGYGPFVFKNPFAKAVKQLWGMRDLSKLIHNGYGPFIFKNPFAKAVKLWGMRNLSKLIYNAHTLYAKYHEAIERDCTDEEFMALFEQYPEFDDMDDEFVEQEEIWTEQIARYIDEHIERFATIRT